MTPLSPRSQSPLLSLPPTNEPSSPTGESTKENHFYHSLTKSLKKVEVDRSDLSDRSNETSSGVGASVDTNDDQLDSTLTSSSSWVGPGEASERSVRTTPTNLANKENAGNSSSNVCKPKLKGRSKKRLNGFQEDSVPLTLVDAQANGFIEKKRKGSPKGKRKKKGANNASVDAVTLKVPQETQHGSKHKQGSVGNVKTHKPDQQQQIGFESSSISSASPPSSVCSHSPLTSPSPTSSFSGQLAVTSVDITKLLARPNLNRATTASNAKCEGSEEKDEWPDLGMDFGTPPPKPKVLKHLEVEAKSLELSPQCRMEEEDSGCNMSMSIGSSIELLAGGAGGGAVGGFKHAKLPLETPPLLASVPVTTASFLAIANPPHCGFGGGGRQPGLLGTPFVGDALLPPPPLPPHNQHHLTSQHYLWVQSQQLNMFIQQHQEQQEKQTGKPIFYPVDHIGHPMGVHPTTPPSQPPLIQQPPLLHPPLIPHLPLPPHLPPHLPLPPPRPLFFPPLKPQVAPNRSVIRTSDPLSPPSPPPPPPLPARPYLLAGPNQLSKNKSK